MLVNFKLAKASIYVNSSYSGGLVAHQVRAATGADLVINAGIYSSSPWAALCDVKANGVTLNKTTDTYRGAAWNTNGTVINADTAFYSYDNFMSCQMCVYNGQEQEMYGLSSDMARSAGRTALIGYTDGTYGAWVTKEGTDDMTATEFRARLAAIPNISWGLMLDGGGSSQLSMAGDEYVYSGRIVHNYLCFWFSDEVVEDTTTPEVETPDTSTDSSTSTTDWGSATLVNGYSVTDSGSTYLSTNFKVSEFQCADKDDIVFISPTLIDVLQNVRDYFGKAVTVLASYRTSSYSKYFPTDENHEFGTAAHISVYGQTPSAVAAYLETLNPNGWGIGVYDSYVHIDVRESRSRW